MIFSAAKDDVEGEKFEFLLFFISEFLLFLNVFEHLFEGIDKMIHVQGVRNGESNYCHSEILQWLQNCLRIFCSIHDFIQNIEYFDNFRVFV